MLRLCALAVVAALATLPAPARAQATPPSVACSSLSFSVYSGVISCTPYSGGPAVSCATYMVAIGGVLSCEPKVTPAPKATASPTPTAAPTATPSASATPTSPPPPTASPAGSAAPFSTPIPPQPVTTGPPPALPAFGAYNSREPGGDLAGLEAQDLAMSQTGLTFEVNYIGLHGNLSGANSIASWLAYDATLSPIMRQFINVKDAIQDADALTGTSLVADGNTDGNLGKACPASDNAQIIACVAKNFSSSPAFGGWYVYDEPGCPTTTIGYCQGSMAGKNYANIAELAKYIASVDPTHPILGIQTASGTPSGGWSATNPTAATQIRTLYSWLSGTGVPNTGMDYYPFPPAFNSPPQTPEQLAAIEALIAANLGPAMTNSFVGQAFAWYQEDAGDCKTITGCPFPTQAQMQAERDNALYYAAAAGAPITYFAWYYWPDTVCINPYPGCNAAANEAAMQAVDSAPFPASAPP